ncbi:MAG: 2-oxo acid dehydrogenase subunit E2, partial [Rhodospirillales bacterium]|nr:2-oxo acid dehydrogenase subunit E2 [Rhodospirillales bacterium]
KSALAKEAAGPKKSAPVKPGLDKSLKLSPVVRKLLAENGLEPSQIAGTGRDGRITRGDVLAHLKGKPKPASTPKSEDGRTVIPFDYRRKAIAEHMMRSKATSAHVLQALEADFSGIDKARKPVAAEWKRREGFSLTYLPFIAKAVCAAMRDFPNINGTVEGENLVVDAQVNLAFAIDLDFQGLIAPVVHDAHLKSVPEIARAVRDLSVRARADNLTPDDMMGATYTITNNGSFGTLITAPIINQPQVAILSTDGVQKKPVVVEVDGEDLIAIRPIGVLAQSFDHRVIDGAYSASFLAKVKEIIETRDWSAAL